MDTSNWKIVVERAHLYSIIINGVEVSNKSDGWWIDREFSSLPLGKYISCGENTLTLSLDTMNLDAEPAPIYVVGDFRLSSVKSGWNIAGAKNVIGLGSWKQQGWPFYSDAVAYEQDFWIPIHKKICVMKFS